MIELEAASVKLLVRSKKRTCSSKDSQGVNPMKLKIMLNYVKK